VRLIPRDEQFYDLFTALARRLSEAAKLLHQLFAEPRRLDYYVAQIKNVEHAGDALTHDVLARIDKSFVTPIDREDIHLLASRLDSVIDLLDGTARRVAMFHITETREPARRLTGVLVRASECIEAGVLGLKRAKIVAERARDIKRLEEEGDAVYHEAIGALFRGTPDPIDVIKWKDVYDKLEDAIDRCEDVANVLESISLKHA
jgi:uncharacterized protein Yka (UPF0111/DUF47 family)